MSNVTKYFTNFKIHTQYSICEGAIKIPELAEYCKTNKVSAIGLSDSYNLCGALEFSQEISKTGTQPIIGSQINFKFSDTIGKIPIFAKTEEGFKNLTKLSSKSYLDVKENDDPHCLIEELFQNKKDLIVLSGGINSLLFELLKKNRTKEVETIISELKKNFPDLFYFEIQRNNHAGEKNLEEIFLNLSGKFKLPIIASREIYYIDQGMHEAHDALL